MQNESLFSKKTNGRSIVEMLTVLAVVGVLSIMGLFAYKAALNKNRANNVLFDTSLAYAKVMTEEIRSDYASVEFIPVSKLTVTAMRNSETRSSVKVTPVSKDVCEILLDYKGTEDIFAIYDEDDATKLTTCHDDQTMIFKLSSAPCSGITCSGHGVCNKDGECSCQTNYSGENCEIFTDPCQDVSKEDDCSILNDVLEEGCVVRKAVSCSGSTPICNKETGVCEACPTIECTDLDCCETDKVTGCLTHKSGACTTDNDAPGSCTAGVCKACSGISDCAVYNEGCQTCKTCDEDYSLLNGICCQSYQTSYLKKFGGAYECCEGEALDATADHDGICCYETENLYTTPTGPICCDEWNKSVYLPKVGGSYQCCGGKSANATADHDGVCCYVTENLYTTPTGPICCDVLEYNGYYLPKFNGSYQCCGGSGSIDATADHDGVCCGYGNVLYTTAAAPVCCEEWNTQSVYLPKVGGSYQCCGGESANATADYDGVCCNGWEKLYTTAAAPVCCEEWNTKSVYLPKVGGSYQCCGGKSANATADHDGVCCYETENLYTTPTGLICCDQGYYLPKVGGTYQCCSGESANATADYDGVCCDETENLYTTPTGPICCDMMDLGYYLPKVGGTYQCCSGESANATADYDGVCCDRWNETLIQTESGYSCKSI